jgi:hypothetical protein
VQWTFLLKTSGEEVLTPELIAKRQFLVVEDVIFFKRRHEDLLRQVFTEKDDYDRFRPCMKEALEHFLNKNPN